MKAIISAILLMSLVSCQSGSDSPVALGASYPVSLSMGGYTTAQLMKNLIIPEAYAAVTDMKVCFKRLRFKTSTDDLAPAPNINFDLGEVTLSNSGTLLGSVNVPAGTYYRIEFDLEPACAGNSISLINDFGAFTSTDTIKIKFDGLFIVNGSEVLELGVQNILSEANAYDGTQSLKLAMEAVSGNL